jgi:hypothetical protein
MIKRALILSLLMISGQAIASTPCPTCKKSYVASSLEEALVSQQKAKGGKFKKITFILPPDPLTVPLGERAPNLFR